MSSSFFRNDRQYSDTNADPDGYRSYHHSGDRLPRSDLGRRGYGLTHADEMARDRSARYLRRREDQEPGTREREQRQDVHADHL